MFAHIQGAVSSTNGCLEFCRHLIWVSQITVDSTPTTILPKIHKSRTRITRVSNAYDVYIGRPGKGLDGVWGNICGQVSAACPMCGHTHEYGKTSLPCYVRLISDQLTSPEIVESIHWLAGQTLGCWCEPGTPCHGDVLALLPMR